MLRKRKLRKRKQRKLRKKPHIHLRGRGKKILWLEV